MATLQLKHIQLRLDEVFKGLIDVSDYQKKPDAERQKACLSRSYAAYTLTSLASAEPEAAAQAIVDGYKDNGIDAIHYDEKEKIFWLVQSKWIDSGKGEPETGEVHKFIHGVKAIIDLKFDDFNEKVKKKQALVEEALLNQHVRVKIVLAYSGTKLGEHNRRIISEFIEDQNATGEIFFFELFSLSEAHGALKESLVGGPISAELTLTQWGAIDEPYYAIYGQIDAQDLAELWIKNGERLFSNNIRSFVGLSDVNDGIQETLLTEPQNFLYLNNGVTVLCQKIHKKPKGGASKSVGQFHGEGLSIVNGAQTVGTIGDTYKKNPEKISQAKVFIKFISLEDCSPDFHLRVTKATNTQNQVENRDFISLDPQQEKLQIEFILSNINYHYKRGDQKYTKDSRNCDFEEASIALACSLNEIRYSHMAKDKIGKLWENVNKSPYTDIFTGKVSADIIWRKIQIMRVVEDMLSHKKNSNVNGVKSTCTYGNRFILHIVFRYFGESRLFSSDIEFANYVENKLPKLIEEVIRSTSKVLSDEYPNKTIYQVFRNLENYKLLKEKLMQLLPIN